VFRRAKAIFLGGLGDIKAHQAGPGPAGPGGGVAGVARVPPSASAIPQPGPSSTAMVRRRPRGSQDACAGAESNAEIGRVTAGRGRERAGWPKAGPAPESPPGGGGPANGRECISEPRQGRRVSFSQSRYFLRQAVLLETLRSAPPGLIPFLDLLPVACTTG